MSFAIVQHPVMWWLRLSGRIGVASRKRYHAVFTKNIEQFAVYSSTNLSSINL